MVLGKMLCLVCSKMCPIFCAICGCFWMFLGVTSIGAQFILQNNLKKIQVGIVSHWKDIKEHSNQLV